MDLPKDLLDRVQVASAAVDMSAREYVTACVRAGLETHAEHDPIIATVFKVISKRIAESRPKANG